MNRRLILGFVVAPLAPCILAATLASLHSGSLVGIPVGTLLYAVFAYPFALALGGPTYWVMSLLGRLSMVPVTVAGFALGLISGALLPLLMGVEWGRALGSGIFFTVSVFGVFGAVTAWVFWWLALRADSHTARRTDVLR